MHEFSLAQDILRIALDAAASHKLGTVSEIRLDVGAASGVHLGALATAWEFVRSAEPATSMAALEINAVPALGDCPACGFRGEVRDYLRICPQCSALGLRLAGGTEFMVTSICGE